MAVMLQTTFSNVIFFKEKCFILLVTLRYNLMTPKLSKFTNKWFEQWPMSDISLWSDDSEYFAISFKITARGRYNAVQYNIILHTPLRLPRLNKNVSVNPQKTPHSYGVSLVRIFEKIGRVITAPDCIFNSTRLRQTQNLRNIFGKRYSISRPHGGVMGFILWIFWWKYPRNIESSAIIV